MEASWTNLLMQIPLAGIVVVTVVIFLREMAKIRVEQSATIKEFMSYIAEQRTANNAALHEVSMKMEEIFQEVCDRMEALEKAVILHEAEAKARKLQR